MAFFIYESIALDETIKLMYHKVLWCQNWRNDSHEVLLHKRSKNRQSAKNGFFPKTEFCFSLKYERFTFSATRREPRDNKLKGVQLYPTGFREEKSGKRKKVNECSSGAQCWAQ